MEKSYNPFKMWGSWVGFCIGLLTSLFVIEIPLFFRLFLHGAVISGNIFILELMTNFVVMMGWLEVKMLEINPIFWISGKSISPTVMMTTSVVLFLYGWIIHSAFRKFSK